MIGPMATARLNASNSSTAEAYARPITQPNTARRRQAIVHATKPTTAIAAAYVVSLLGSANAPTKPAGCQLHGPPTRPGSIACENADPNTCTTPSTCGVCS